MFVEECEKCAKYVIDLSEHVDEVCLLYKHKTFSTGLNVLLCYWLLRVDNDIK